MTTDIEITLQAPFLSLFSMLLTVEIQSNITISNNYDRSLVSYLAFSYKFLVLL